MAITPTTDSERGAEGGLGHAEVPSCGGTEAGPRSPQTAAHVVRSIWAIRSLSSARLATLGPAQGAWTGTRWVQTPMPPAPEEPLAPSPPKRRSLGLAGEGVACCAGLSPPGRPRSGPHRCPRLQRYRRRSTCPWYRQWCHRWRYQRTRAPQPEPLKEPVVPQGPGSGRRRKPGRCGSAQRHGYTTVPVSPTRRTAT